MRFVRILFAVLLSAALVVGGFALYNHRIALRQVQESRDEAARKVEEQQQTILAQQTELERLKGELEKLNAGVAAIEATRRELLRAKEDADARAALFNDFVRTFRKLIDAGRLELTVRHGRIVLALQSEVLFDTGKAEIRPDGRTALAEIAHALRSVKDRRFQVAGHTDGQPIHNAEFASNWELSSARAVEVVKLLVSEGVPAAILSSTGYAEYQPVASNQTPPGRAKNRRIEITLEPNVGSLMNMPQMKM